MRVIHRDIKADNIFLAVDGLKIGDFGISKYVGEITRSRTFKGWGTVAYMAQKQLPETPWTGDRPTSLGIVFYEMAAFKRPFVGSDDELARAHCTRPESD